MQDNKNSRRRPSFEELLDGSCLIHGSGHKARECFSLRSFATEALKVAPARQQRTPRNNKKDDDKTDAEPDDFQDTEKEVNFICGGPDACDSKRKQKLALREVNAIEPATPEFLRWSEVPITFDRSDHPQHIPRPGRYPLVLPAVINKVKLHKTFVE